MKPPSSNSDQSPALGLFDGVLAAGGVRAEVGDEAWVRALLDAEAALARAAARVGLIPAADAEAVAAACAALEVDIAAVGAEAAASGTPVVPLVRRLRAALPDGPASAVHLGATSQDIMDTATMLVARRALIPLLDDLVALVRATADLAYRHRATLVTGRTLLQQALPTTFGLVAAGWLTGLDRARRRLIEVRDAGLAAQLGGAVGTLAAYGAAGWASPSTPSPPESGAFSCSAGLLPDVGIELTAAFAAELGLAVPDLPWHTERTRIADLAGALGAAAGAIGKVARDVTLSARTEVAELTEGAGEGGSSTMPHKHNPIRAISAAAAAAQAPGLVATLLAVMPQEYQRAAGGWHAEWRPLRSLLECTGSAAYQLRQSLDGLQVDTERMRAGFDLANGALLAERVAVALRTMVGAQRAHELVREASGDLAGDPRIAEHLSADELSRLLDPATYLGSTATLIDRALAAARR